MRKTAATELAAVLCLAGLSAQALGADAILPAPETIQIPEISVPLSARDLDDSDKYFFFHRARTEFAAAFSDVAECDSMARNLLPGTGNPTAVGGLAVAIGVGAIASANQRNVRRLNLRRCMFFKGYGRYGLPKSAWQQIAFDESGAGVSDERRRPYLLKQAKLASGPAPRGRELGE